MLNCGIVELQSENLAESPDTLVGALSRVEAGSRVKSWNCGTVFSLFSISLQFNNSTIQQLNIKILPE